VISSLATPPHQFPAQAWPCSTYNLLEVTQNIFTKNMQQKRGQARLVDGVIAERSPSVPWCAPSQPLFPLGGARSGLHDRLKSRLVAGDCAPSALPKAARTHHILAGAITVRPTSSAAFDILCRQLLKALQAAYGRRMLPADREPTVAGTRWQQAARACGGPSPRWLGGLKSA
jgi:hypothetical protein